jgi:hypothetical protein
MSPLFKTNLLIQNYSDLVLHILGKPIRMGISNLYLAFPLLRILKKSKQKCFNDLARGLILPERDTSRFK